MKFLCETGPFTAWLGLCPWYHLIQPQTYRRLLQVSSSCIVPSLIKGEGPADSRPGMPPTVVPSWCLPISYSKALRRTGAPQSRDPAYQEQRN